MLRTRKLSREEQIALMDGALDRMQEHARKWLRNPALKADLHRFDNKKHGQTPTPKQAFGR